MLSFLFHVASLTLFCVFLLGDDKGLFVVILALTFALLETSAWAFRQRRDGQLNWCHPVPVFVLGYIIVFYQLPFSYLAGFNLSFYSDYVLFSPENIAYCVLLSAVGLSAFFCGDQLFYLKQKGIVSIYQRKAKCPQNEYFKSHRFNNVNFLVLFLAIISFYLYLQSLGGLEFLFKPSYGDVYKISGVYSTYFGFAYTIFLYLAILLQIFKISKIYPQDSSSYFKAWDRSTLIVVVVTLIPFFISGDRGAYLQPLALIVAPYFIFVRPLRFFQAAVLVAGLALILVAVGDIRGQTEEGLLKAIKIRFSSFENPAEWPTMELANSFGTFNVATVYFPHRFEYQGGTNALYGVASIVPFSNFFTDISRKNIETGYLYSSALFFTNILTKGTFSSGAGTSSLADIYMDFGPVGIPIVLFLWGFFMGWISKLTFLTYSPFLIFLYAFYSYYGIYVNRSSFFFGWNHFVWVLMLFYVIKRFYLEKGRG